MFSGLSHNKYFVYVFFLLMAFESLFLNNSFSETMTKTLSPNTIFDHSNFESIEYQKEAYGILSNDYILGFKETDLGKSDDIGNKGLNLSLMYQIGAPTLPGFNIRKKAIREFLKEKIPGTDETLEEKIEAITSVLNKDSTEGDLQKVENQIEELFFKVSMPKDVLRAIENAYTYFHKKGYSSFSARSSSITIREDSEKHSFPGMFNSYLNCINFDQLEENIKRVWLSQYSKGVLRYRVENNLSQTRVDMGVVVQSQLDSDISGVYYTVAVGDGILNKNSKSQFNVGRKLGPGIVDGGNTLDLYKHKADGSLSTFRPGNQRYKVVFKKGGGVEKVYIPEAERLSQEALISPDKIEELQELVNKTIYEIEKKRGYIAPFGYDVEWAMKDGKIYIFQARPLAIMVNDPRERKLLSLLARLANDREMFMRLEPLLNKERMDERELEGIIADLALMKQRVNDKKDLLPLWNDLLEHISESLYFQKNAFELLNDDIPKLKKTLNKEGDGVLKEVFDQVVLKAFRKGQVPVFEGKDFENVDKYFKSIKKLDLRLAFLEMIFNVKIYSIRNEDIIAFHKKFISHYPELRDDFILWAKSLFDVDEKTGQLKKIERPKLELLFIPIFLNKKFEIESKGFGPRVLKDSRLKETVTLDDFFYIGFHILLFKDMNDQVSFEEERKLLPNLLESPEFWEKYSLIEIKEALAFILGQDQIPSIKKAAEKGVKALLGSKRILPPSFLIDLYNSILLEFWPGVEIKIPSSVASRWKVAAKKEPSENEQSADLSGLGGAFKAYANWIIDTGKGLKSNIYEVQDLIKDAIEAAKESRESDLDFLLLTLDSIFKIRGYHGKEWRTKHDEKYRKPEYSLRFDGMGYSDDFEDAETMYDNMLKTSKTILFEHKQITKHYREVKSLLNRLREKMAEKYPGKINLLDKSYYLYFANFFSPPNTPKYDIDDAVRALQGEVLMAAQFLNSRELMQSNNTDIEPDPGVRFAKRVFIEKAWDLIPGTVDVGVNWRTIHDDFEDLDRLAEKEFEAKGLPYPEELVSRLKDLRIRVHNELDESILSEAREIHRILHDQDVDKKSPLYIKHTSLVKLLEKLYLPLGEQHEDINELKNIITSDLLGKVERAYTHVKENFQTIHNQEHIDINKLLEEIFLGFKDEKLLTNSLVKIEFLRAILQKLLSNYPLNTGVNPYFNTKERLSLIRLEIALERLESGLVSTIEDKKDFNFMDLVDYSKWLQLILINAEDVLKDKNFIGKGMIRRATSDFTRELEKGNIYSASNIWRGKLRIAISKMNERRQLLAFRLFEFAAQKIDRFFFREELIPIAPGKASGKVRIIKEYKGEHELESIINHSITGVRPDEILVLDQIPRVINITSDHIPAGIIVEEGSVASHASSTVRTAAGKIIPTIVMPDARENFSSDNWVEFLVPVNMSRVVMTTSNLHRSEILSVEEGDYLGIRDGKAFGRIKKLSEMDIKKIIERGSEDREEAFQARATEILVLKNINFSMFEFLKEYGIPAAIIIEEGTDLTYPVKVLRRVELEYNHMIPLIRIRNATSMFKDKEDDYVELQVRGGNSKVFTFNKKGATAKELHISPPIGDRYKAKTKRDFLYRPRLVFGQLKGNIGKFRELISHRDKSIGKPPIVHLGNYIGSDEGTLTLLEELFSEKGDIAMKKDIAIIGDNERLFLLAMLGDLKDFRTFIDRIGRNICQELNISLPKKLRNLNQSHLNNFQGNNRLKALVQKMLDHGRIYYRENDTIFIATGSSMEENGQPVIYKSTDGKEYIGIKAFKRMQEDFQSNPLFYLRSNFQNKKKNLTELFAVIGDKNLNKILQANHVQRIVSMGSSRHHDENQKFISLGKNTVLSFNSYGISSWESAKGDVNQIEILEAATATNMARKVDLPSNLMFRHVRNIQEYHSLQKLLAKNMKRLNSLPTFLMNMKWMALIDKESGEVVGGLSYYIKGDRAHLFSIDMQENWRSSEIGETLIQGFIYQLQFEGVDTFDTDLHDTDFLKLFIHDTKEDHTLTDQVKTKGHNTEKAA